MRLVRRRWVLLLVVVCVASLVVAEVQRSIAWKAARSSMERAAANLRVGMTPEEARQSLEEATGFVRCDYETWSEELHLFGTEDIRGPSNLWIFFDKKGSSVEVLKEAARLSDSSPTVQRFENSSRCQRYIREGK